MSVTIVERDVPTTVENDVLQVSLYYWPDARVRGYYLNVTPCKIDRSTPGFVGRQMEIGGARSGKSVLVLQVARRSRAQDAQACQLAARAEAAVIAEVCARSGLVVARPIDLLAQAIERAQQPQQQPEPQALRAPSRPGQLGE